MRFSKKPHEIGVRLALGASHRDILKLVAQRTAKLIGCGLAFGLAGEIAVTQISSSFVADFAGLDSITYISVSCFLALVALLATYVPARRAMCVDPMVALRHE